MILAIYNLMLYLPSPPRCPCHYLKPLYHHQDLITNIRISTTAPPIHCLSPCFVQLAVQRKHNSSIYCSIPILEMTPYETCNSIPCLNYSQSNVHLKCIGDIQYLHILNLTALQGGSGYRGLYFSPNNDSISCDVIILLFSAISSVRH